MKVIKIEERGLNFFFRERKGAELCWLFLKNLFYLKIDQRIGRKKKQQR